jgi:hypothetical protein
MADGVDFIKTITSPEKVVIVHRFTCMPRQIFRHLKTQLHKLAYKKDVALSFVGN